LTDDTKEKKLAEAVFKKEERSSKAMAEYKATVEAERAKTERLRALRLAKEAAGKSK
jgi:ABC-type Fe3+-hydroxamate transport system substrate-binding protein